MSIRYDKYAATIKYPFPGCRPGGVSGHQDLVEFEFIANLRQIRDLTEVIEFLSNLRGRADD